jgi:ubiquinone/menaquinone biosynthesis C-methylase UbiE
LKINNVERFFNEEKRGRIIDLYETDELLALTGSTIRPGGLLLTDRAMDFCRFAPGARIGDVGCGSCGTLEHLLNAHNINALGIDPSSILLNAGLRRAPGLPVVQGVAEVLPFRDGWFDGLFCECVISLLADSHLALKEFSRVLRSGGFLIITDMYLRSPASMTKCKPLPNKCCLWGARPKEEMLEILSRQGFSLCLWEDHTDALKELAARLILTHGSLEAFWKSTCLGEMSEAAIVAKPGYFLLIARKKKDD